MGIPFIKFSKETWRRGQRDDELYVTALAVVNAQYGVEISEWNGKAEEFGPIVDVDPEDNNSLTMEHVLYEPDSTLGASNNRVH